MKFQLSKTLAKSFSIAPAAEDTAKVLEPEISLTSFAVNVCAPDAKLADTFAINFQIEASLTASHCAVINCNYWAYFKCEQELTLSFLESHFASVNAPAIAYPYLRSFLTNALVSAGYPAVYLPTVNFVELAKQQEKD